MMENFSTFLTVLVLGVGIWNTYMHSSIKTVMLELQLNLRREFNGRYVTLDRFEDLKKDVEDLEDEVDSR